MFQGRLTLEQVVSLLFVPSIRSTMNRLISSFLRSAALAQLPDQTGAKQPDSNAFGRAERGTRTDESDNQVRKKQIKLIVRSKNGRLLLIDERR